MIATADGIRALRPLLVGERGELVRSTLNSTSPAEVNLALGILSNDIRDRDLVTLVNLREVLAELPSTPMPMPMDFASLAGIAGYETDGAVASRCYDDEAAAPFDLVLLGEGNLCYDLVVRVDGASVYWTEHADSPHLIHPEALELVLARETLLQRVVELVDAMGLPVNPRFYLSLEDFRLEHVEDAFDDLLHGLF